MPPTLEELLAQRGIGSVPHLFQKALFSRQTYYNVINGGDILLGSVARLAAEIQAEPKEFTPIFMEWLERARLEAKEAAVGAAHSG